MNEMAQRAHELYVPGVFGYSVVAKKLGVSTTTVRRLLTDGDAEKMRVQAREAKRRRVGVCEDCGGPTRYSGKSSMPRICSDCSHARERAAKVWTREAVITAIQKWAEQHGAPPVSTQWIRAGADHPARTSVYRAGDPRSSSPFQKWADAIEAAGFERPEAGGRYRERPQLWKFDHAEALRLLEAGLSRAEVARRLDVNAETIRRLKAKGSFAKRREEAA